LDDFGEEAASDTLNNVNEGRIRVETLQKYLYGDKETREQYAERIKNEYKPTQSKKRMRGCEEISVN